MSPDERYQTLLEGLRGTLLERATTRNRAELTGSPEVVAERRELLGGWLNSLQSLSFDPDMSDEAFWGKAFSKPFYIRHVAAVAEDKERTMRLYLGDRKALCSADWDIGGPKYRAFLSDEGCYRNEEQLQMVIGAARRIENILTANPAPEFQDLPQIKFATLMRRVLHGLPDWTSISSLKTIHARLQSLMDYPFVTTFHLMTDLGLPVVKPDQVLTQVALRLGLVTGYMTKGGKPRSLDPSITSRKASELGQKPEVAWALQEVMQQIAKLTGYTVRQVDGILVKLGQEVDETKGIVRTICGSDMPSCNICTPAKLCAYGSRN
jgi:DNA-3-methyladenine glycosylase I